MGLIEDVEVVQREIPPVGAPRQIADERRLSCLTCACDHGDGERALDGHQRSPGEPWDIIHDMNDNHSRCE